MKGEMRERREGKDDEERQIGEEGRGRENDRLGGQNKADERTASVINIPVKKHF